MNKIFLVDADDTILDFHGVSALALRASFSALNIPWQDWYLSEYKRINNELWQALERRALTRSDLMSKRFHWYLAEIGLTEVDGDAFNKEYLHYLSTNPVYFDGAEDFLRTLNAVGRVYIVTNGTYTIQKSRFDISKLWDYAEEVFISEKIGCDKPGKGYSDYVVAHIPNFDKKNCYWIGDSLSADIKAANDLGVTSIWFNPQNKSLNCDIVPDYNVQNYDEILKICKQ